MQKNTDFFDQHSEFAFDSYKVRIFDGIAGDTSAASFVTEDNIEILDFIFLRNHRYVFKHFIKMYLQSTMIRDYRYKFDVDYNNHNEHASMGKIGALTEVLEESNTILGTLYDRASSFNQDIVRSYYDDYVRAIELGISHDVMALARVLFFAQTYQSLIANYVNASVKYRLLHHLAFWSALALTAVNVKEAAYQSNNCPNARLT